VCRFSKFIKYINLTHSYQVFEQLKRLKKIEEIERSKNSFVEFKNNKTMRLSESREPLISGSMRTTEANKGFIETRGGLCFNLRLIWSYNPST